MDVLLEFVGSIKTQLSDMDVKLDALGDTVGAIHADVKRLAGRPFLEIYLEWSERVIAPIHTQLRSEGRQWITVCILDQRFRRLHIKTLVPYRLRKSTLSQRLSALETKRIS